MKNKRINLVVIFLMVITLIMATAISASAATVKINKKTVKISILLKNKQNVSKAQIILSGSRIRRSQSRDLRLVR